MKIKINLPADYRHLHNEYHMFFARSWNDLKYCYEVLDEINFSVNIVERHVIPNNSTALVKRGFEEKTNTLEIDVRIFRIIPSLILKEAVLKEFRSIIDCD